MNWIELKALNSLYINGETKLNDTLDKSGEINYLINSLRKLEKSYNKLSTLEGFTETYEKDYLKTYKSYEIFLSENQLLKPQLRFEENDIKILMNIQAWKKEGTLEELRNQIIASDESLRGVSLMFFKNEKYLDNKASLVNALKQILEVEHFANEKDQQYIYKLECYKPKTIILCENLDFLTKPNKPRQHGIELWYAGGKNINKLDFTDTRGLPIYYSCDWDYDGLFIIYPLVKEKIPTIQLLTPNGEPRGIEETEHSSKWAIKDRNIDSLLTFTQLNVLKGLIKNNQWIIEESNNLIDMLKI
ncbi:hypothetical protein [Flavivirga sp. 57AJ16]|uniref:hypothetical protein n=1 Tax=Flavivirga sp. 57AJ16 TaxID=3025307 RepID=UPI0023650CAA|nr:hypothetical protein [Flavivirga sp. 57AJ16]MDD7885256.1 hypothetical protein [Flavivirga sp. 57AJ16]